MLTRKSKIFLAGHNGMIGSAILRLLNKKKFNNIIIKERKELDLTNQDKVFKFLKRVKPEATIIAAAKVGGIKANNDQKAELIENCIIELKRTVKKKNSNEVFKQELASNNY